MNVKNLLVIVISFTSFVAFSQIEFKPGIRAGANISKFTNSDSSNKTDFYVGAQFGIKFVKFYTLQPELTYSRQGADVVQYDNYYNLDPIVGITTRNVKYNLDYLSIGRTNKFTFGSGFQVLVGPTIDIKVGDNLPSYSSSELIGFDFALVGGIGYEFKNGLALEARFKQGLVDIFGNNYNEYNDNNGNGNYDEVILNQLFQVGVAYSFDLKK
jgi:hypothetical protein